MPVNTPYLSGDTTVFSNVSLNAGGRLMVSQFSNDGTSSFAAGAAGAPSITFSGNTNTGIFRVATDELGITVAGAQVASWISNQGSAVNLLSVDGLALRPVVAFTSEQSLGFYRSAASTFAFSRGTLDLAANSVRLSYASSADTASMSAGELRLVFRASGISLVWSSGASHYVVGGSATSGAAV